MLKEFVGENKVVKAIVDAVGTELINQSAVHASVDAIGLNPCSKLSVCLNEQRYVFIVDVCGSRSTAKEYNEPTFTTRREAYLEQ